MARGGDKLEEGTEKVVSADNYLGTGGINHARVGSLIQGGDTVGSFLCEGYVGDDPLNVAGTGVLQ